MEGSYRGFRLVASAFRRKNATTGALLVMLAAFPQTTQACAICFGAADSPLLDAARLGVLAMVAVTLAVLAAFGRWFLRLRRLERDRPAHDPS